ncbi:hypothetical protein MBAV_001003 [Candidatus Magnetobacterium bavaricum]|uniref:Uncharacterized protein n=1 Tax=Candidatus Magnetobacterium bavaricum TaxID=29290 RepID=A0A0F3GY88_9BACT|nr:hypothetical protein MBAV_001003 [Candidatus Magnetobacterium bavaricum]
MITLQVGFEGDWQVRLLCRGGGSPPGSLKSHSPFLLLRSNAIALPIPVALNTRYLWLC